MPKAPWRGIVDLCPGDAALQRKGWRRLRGAAASGAALIAAVPGLAFGADAPLGADLSSLSLDTIHQHQGVVGLSVFLGLVLYATITSLLHLTGRARWTQQEAKLDGELTEANARLERAKVFLSAEHQIVVAWGAASGEPDIEGDLTLVMDAPVPRRVLGFGSWLRPELAQQMDAAVEKLRQRGEGFRMTLQSLNGRHLDVEGRAISGRAVLRIRDISGDRLELTRLRDRHARALADMDVMRTMLDALPAPVWMRDGDGRLTFVNRAYVGAVEARDANEAILRQTELLDRRLRDAAETAREKSEIMRVRAPAVIAGKRHLFDIIDVPAAAGSMGMAGDLSELESVQASLQRQMESHARTLDQLPTAVAIFDRTQHLVFHNAAYRQLWSLDAGFLEQRPTDNEVLDRLRTDRKLPEQADFRSWKAGVLANYHSVETNEQTWHLPDGRTLRAVINPNSQGGVTYLFDDMSERVHLEKRFNAFANVQSETLEALREGVAVFGSDGRLKLFNPAFIKAWPLGAEALGADIHIDKVAQLCAPLFTDQAGWSELRGIVSGLHEARTGAQLRMARRDGAIFDCLAAPLPDGATLLTFTDVTAGVNVERALTERNEALTEAEAFRNDFVHHVSYELRSPLTNIIGFTQMLGNEMVGPLNPRQGEYASYVMQSSKSLLAIIDNILDLASIDKGALELSLADVDLAQAMAAAAEGVQDRLAESSMHLQIVAMDGLGLFRADAQRMRQILFNLLSNAIGFSAPGQTITLAALRRGGEIVLKVSDQGRGIPAEVLERVFDRFETHTIGSKHRGLGLGLSIVRSLVELHGGKVLIDTAPGEGTTVTCVFPAPGAAAEAPGVVHGASP